MIPILILLLSVTVAFGAGGRGISGRPPVLTSISTVETNRIIFADGLNTFSVVGDNPLAEQVSTNSVVATNTSNAFFDLIAAHAQSRTNGHPDYYRAFSNFVKGSYPPPRAATSWIWNTNSVLYSNGVAATGITGIGVAQSLGATSTQTRFTLLTRRIAVTAGHYFTYQGTNDMVETRNQPVYFLTLSNTLVTQFVARVYAYFDTGRDKAYLWFTNDVPDSITPLRIAQNGIYFGLEAYTSKCGTNTFDGAFYANQDGYVNQFTLTRTGLRQGSPYPGDSGSTCFFIGTNNEAIFVTTISSAPTDAVTIQRIKTITETEGLDTNTYAPQLIDISGYP